MKAGLTGGIGSGKSMVARIFGILGWQVFSADDSARLAYFDPDVRRQVIALLGGSVYDAGNKLNKTVLRSALLEGKGDALNAIIHPYVVEEFEKFAAAHAGTPVLRESALLHEAGRQSDVDYVVTVTAPDELRIARVMERDRVDRETVLKLMARQWPQEKKAAVSDFIIENDEKRFVVPQVISVHEQLLSLRK